MLAVCTFLPCLLRSSSAFSQRRSSSLLFRTTRTTTATLLKTASASASTSSTSTPTGNLLLHQKQLDHDYYCLRHGQSLANVQGVIASNPDTACFKYGLSDTGHAQAAQAGLDVVAQFKQASLSSSSTSLCSPPTSILILSSDLLRAVETADHVKAAVLKAGLPLVKNAVISEIRLRERWFGDWDETVDTNYEKVWVDDAVNAAHVNSGVESVDSVMGRSTECILEVEERDTNNGLVRNKLFVVCVAHGDVLQILQTAFLKMDGRLHRSLEHLETATLRAVKLAG